MQVITVYDDEREKIMIYVSTYDVQRQSTPACTWQNNTNADFPVLIRANSSSVGGVFAANAGWLNVSNVVVAIVDVVKKSRRDDVACIAVEEDEGMLDIFEEVMNAEAPDASAADKRTMLVLTMIITTFLILPKW